jgi:alkanesulfonate monooxygenase SsuD/methylene tetrahydromethanopterin reductase-like flavin-dependent oxidoreductase (luciferase family)
LIGGGGEQKTLRLVARHADAWHSFGNLETFAHKSAVLDRRCAEIGRNPAEIERSIGVNPRRLELGDEYLKLGASQITLGFGGPDYDLTPVPDWIAWRDGL